MQPSEVILVFLKDKYIYGGDRPLKKIILISVLLPLLTLNFMSCSKDSTSQPENEPTFAEKLQGALDNGLDAYNGIGISAAVIMPDGEMWVGVSGVSHGTTKITSDMPFGAGSIAKNFTATTILQLAEAGELTLEDSLYEWLPAYPYVDSTITVRQLLNHTSGLFDFVDNPDFWNAILEEPSKVWTPEEIITSFMLILAFTSINRIGVSPLTPIELCPK